MHKWADDADAEADDAEADQFIDECPPWADAGRVMWTRHAERELVRMLDEMLYERGLTRFSERNSVSP